MSASLDDLLAAVNNTNQNLGRLIQAIQNWPALAQATTATAGSATLPASPAGFFVVKLSTGSTVKIPYYNP
jgi:hypothetical protein